MGGAGCSDSDVFRDMQERIYGWCVRQRRTVGSEGVDQYSSQDLSGSV